MIIATRVTPKIAAVIFDPYRFHGLRILVLDAARDTQPARWSVLRMDRVRTIALATFRAPLSKAFGSGSAHVGADHDHLDFEREQ